MKNTIYLQHSNIELTKKPNSTEIRTLNKEIIRNKPCTLTPDELLFNILGKGKTILTGTFNKRRTKRSLKQASVLLLDFDNKDETNPYTINDLINDDFMLENAVGYYHTFSYLKEKERFRVLFVLPEPIYSSDLYEEIYSELLLKYPMADSKCKDVSRIFYGGTNPKLINAGNILTDIKTDLYKNQSKENKKGLRLYNQISHALENRSQYTDINTAYIKYIHENNLDAYKDFLNQNHLVLNIFVNSLQEAIYVIKRLDMRKLLGIDKNRTIKYNPFKCILYEDDNPSASIFKINSTDSTKDGIYLYKRFSGSFKPYDIFTLFQELTGRTKLDSELLLCKLLNVKIKGQKINIYNDLLNDLNRFQLYLFDDKFEVEYPYTYKILKTFRKELDGILLMYKQNVYSNQSIDMYFKIETYVQKIYGEFNKSTRVTKSKADRINKILNLLSYLGILHMKEDSEINEELLQNLNENKNNKNFKYRPNVYSIKKDSFNLERIEELSKNLLDNHYTFSGFNSKFLASIETNNLNKAYVQYSYDLSERDIKFKSYITNYIINHFENHNEYIFEYDIKLYLETITENSIRVFSNKYIKKQYNVLIPSVLNELNLNKKRLSKELKQRFNLEHLGKLSYTIYFKK